MATRKVKVPNSGHLMAVGLTGGGKSTFMTALFTEQFFSNERATCIDLYDEGRLECALHCFPLRSKYQQKLWNVAQQMNIEPRAFPTEVLLPSSQNLNDIELPDNFRPFRIPYSSLSASDFSVLLSGELSPVAEEVLSLIGQEVQTNSLSELIDEVADFSSKRISVGSDDSKPLRLCDKRTTGTLLRKLLYLRNLGLVGDNDDPLNLDLTALMKDNAQIHSFSTKFIQDESVRYLFYHWFLRALFQERLKMKAELPKLALLIREISNLAPRSSAINPLGAATAQIVGRWCRESRDLGCVLLVDSQRIREINPVIYNEITHLFAFNLSKSDADYLGKEVNLPKDFVKQIPSLKTGQCVYHCPTHDFKMFVRPPACMVKPAGLDVLNFYREMKIPFKRISLAKLLQTQVREINPSLSENQKKIIKIIIEKEGKVTIEEISDVTGIGYHTVYRNLETIGKISDVSKEKGQKKVGSGRRPVIWKFNLQKIQDLSVQ